MYRLLKLKSTRPRATFLSSLNVVPEIGANRSAETTCEFCNKLGEFSKIFIRHQSTMSNPSVKVRKKRIKTLKKYAELLVVSENSTTQKKAPLLRLNPNDLKLLALTNLNLNELYKLKDLSKDHSFVEEHTYNNLTIIDNLTVCDILPPWTFKDKECEPVNSSLISTTSVLPGLNLDGEDSFLVKNNFFPDLARVIEEETELVQEATPFQPEVIEEHPEPCEEEVKEAEIREKKPRAPIDLKAREEIITKTLASYLEVCSNLKIPQRGLSALNFHRSRSKRSDKIFFPIKSPNVYNALLKGFASKGNFQKINEIVNIMKDEEVELNLQSYIAIFECLGRVNIRDSHLKQIRIYGKEATRSGITFQQILNRGVFLNDEREKVLSALKSYDPTFNPNFSAPALQYKNCLVDHLNNDTQLIPHRGSGVVNRGMFSQEDLAKRVDRQLSYEKDGFVTVKSIEARGEATEDVLRHRETLGQHYRMWEEAALEAFNRDLSTLSAKRSAFSFEPYMRCIPTKDFITIIVDEAKKLAQGSETYSPTVNMLYRDLGGKVYARYKVLRKQRTGVIDKVLDVHKKYCGEYASMREELGVLPTEEKLVNPRQQWQWAEYSLKGKGATLQMDHQEWVPTALQNIGKFLYHIIMHDLKIDVNSLRNSSKHKNYLPAFYTIFRTQGRIIKEEVKPHPVLSKLYRASIPETLTFPTSELPMVCPPIPWVSVCMGGYLVSPCDMVRLPYQATAQKQRMLEAAPNQLFPSLDALNQLAAVPWRVNTRILDVILEVFNAGGSAKLDVPEPPSSLAPPPSPTPEMDKSQKFALLRQKLQHRRKKAEMYSLWCDCLYRLSLANHFRDETFWLPHNMDFRGRVYPVPPHLNHLGSDLARSMMVFAESRPLGPDGLNWLKLHLVNLTGLKKRDPISVRLAFAEEIMDDILDSADRPLTGRKWWAESEEPWQTLACCMEVANAVRSPDPEKFRSHFPIHQDGSCNGLQHYAALGRDSAGAFSVNLVPSHEPQDVYSAVVALVEQQRVKDADNGMEIAKLLEGFVKRKVIKQTIMTTVYGVTRFGARLQIAKQLKDVDDFPKDQVWAASSYLTGRTFDSLRTMFTSTREIQDWFTECARLISAVGGQHVEWVTPLGLPIVQPYFRYKKLNATMLYEPFHMDKYEKPNVLKQKNAFPPNFIHSLDSSHMMLTSLHCERAGITFVSVHDCYWTHASTVHIMNKICREQFVALHSQPILEDLSDFLAEKYSYSDSDFTDDGSVIDLTKRKLNRVLRQLPSTGDFDIRKVLDSTYFFS